MTKECSADNFDPSAHNQRDLKFVYRWHIKARELTHAADLLSYTRRAHTIAAYAVRTAETGQRVAQAVLNPPIPYEAVAAHYDESYEAAWAEQARREQATQSVPQEQ